MIPERDKTLFRSEIDRVHPFEHAGFGHAPYHCFGSSEAKHYPAPGICLPGASCDYCGTGIMQVYHVISRDGVKFKVGSDCVRKVCKEFDGQIPESFRKEFARVEWLKRDARREAKWERLKVRRERARVILAAHPDAFTDVQHPTPSFARQGLTLRAYWEWMLDKAGVSGMTMACKQIEALDDVP